jgi:hypothetical protein
MQVVRWTSCSSQACRYAFVACWYYANPASMPPLLSPLDSIKSQLYWLRSTFGCSGTTGSGSSSKSFWSRADWSRTRGWVAVPRTRTKMGCWGTPRDGPSGLTTGTAGLGCTNRDVGVGIGVDNPPDACLQYKKVEGPGSDGPLGAFTSYTWPKVGDPGPLRGTLDECFRDRDQDFCLLPLALLQMDGLYSSSVPSSLSLSIESVQLAGEPFG